MSEEHRQRRLIWPATARRPEEAPERARFSRPIWTRIQTTAAGHLDQAATTDGLQRMTNATLPRAGVLFSR